MIDQSSVVATAPLMLNVIPEPRAPAHVVPSGERWNFQFGARVECTDRQIGTTVGLTIDPLTRALTHLVVRQGNLQRHVVVKPDHLVADADGVHVQLAVTQVDLDRDMLLRDEPPMVDEGIGFLGSIGQFVADSRQFFHPSFDLSAPTLLGDDATTLTLSAQTRIAIGDQSVGALRGIVVDSATWLVTDIVVYRGLFRASGRIVPLARVKALDRDRLILDLNLAALAAAPEYCPDTDIASDCREALMDDEFIHPLSGDYLHVAVRNGVVTVTGNIRATSHRPRVDAAVRHVAGVLAYRNLVYGDDELEATVAAALGDDPRTSEYFIPVQSTNGSIRLEGIQPAVALAIARGVPGVRDVVATA